MLEKQNNTVAMTALCSHMSPTQVLSVKKVVI